MAEKNIEMNVMNESGGYDVLYPKTTPEQAGSLSISGGTMQGDLILNRDPVNNLGAASKQYVDNYVGELVNTGEYLSDKWNLVFNQYIAGKESGNAYGIFKSFTITDFFSEIMVLIANYEGHGMGSDEVFLCESEDEGRENNGLMILNEWDAGILEDSNPIIIRKIVETKFGKYKTDNRGHWASYNGSVINTGIYTTVNGTFTIYVR